jgi:hypothetical protein
MSCTATVCAGALLVSDDVHMSAARIEERVVREGSSPRSVPSGPHGFGGEIGLGRPSRRRRRARSRMGKGLMGIT